MAETFRLTIYYKLPRWLVSRKILMNCGFCTAHLLVSHRAMNFSDVCRSDCHAFNNRQTIPCLDFCDGLIFLADFFLVSWVGDHSNHNHLHFGGSRKKNLQFTIYRLYKWRSKKETIWNLDIIFYSVPMISTCDFSSLVPGPAGYLLFWRS